MVSYQNEVDKIRQETDDLIKELKEALFQQQEKEIMQIVKARDKKLLNLKQSIKQSYRPNISREQIMGIFKNKLNNDVAIKIAAYIAHPIHQDITAKGLEEQGKELNIPTGYWNSSPGRDAIYDNWSSRTRSLKHECMRNYLTHRERTVSRFNRVHYFGPNYHNRTARAMTHEEFCTETGMCFDNYFETAYIPATTMTTKNKILAYALINNLKICKSWNKQKMIQHIYKSID